MSKREWAAIVYGRSYHLDFRFITIPDNFTEQDTQWAASHIVATTQQARNLNNSPRWSIFKNNSHCIVGVTCMVRDLIDKLGQDLIEVMTKDDQGRPLYIFVGYVTKLEQQQNIDQFPPYTETCLDNFKLLYQSIEKVWLVKNYDPQSKSPLLSHYQPRNFSGEEIAIASEQIIQLNDLKHHPDQTFLWRSLRQQNQLLWIKSAQCSQPTSTCLSIKGKYLFNSPFLNQSIDQLEKFQIKKRIVTARKDSDALPSENMVHSLNSSLSQKISHRAKKDIDLTVQQAAKIAIAGQELINNFNGWSNHRETNSDPETEQPENFGFKTKKSSSNPSSNQDWF